MISIPVFAQIENISIFRDDEQTNKFYYLPRFPRIATADNGKPMFTFLRYQFPIERDNQEPGGGYLVFTTRLTEEQALLDSKVIPSLKRALQQENPTAISVPEPILAPVDFTGGEVQLIMIRDNQFVGAVQLGKPSLFGDNTASVAVELKSMGATLLFEALKGGASIAAIEYDLSFPVRLPAITIIGHVDSKEVKQAVMTYTEQQVTEGSVWGDTTSTVRRRTGIAETMDAQGLIKLEILKGSVDLSQDDMESLRSFAFRAMDDFIKANFLKGGSVETPEDRKSEWMEFLGQNITKRFDLNVSYRDVITRQYNPSAQISPAFLGVPIKDVLLDIDLGNAPWYFNNLEVTIDTNLDFAKYTDIVHSVVGHLTYDQPRADGTRLVKRESFVFTAADRAPKTFKTRLVDVGKDIYHVDVEVNYKAGPTLQAKLASFDTMTRNLTLSVQNPGVMEIKFATVPKAFDASMQAIEVEIAYADPRNSVPRAVETVILNAEKTEAQYRRVLFAVWEKSFQYRATYLLKDDSGNVQRSTTEWIDASNDTHNVLIPTPFDSQFNLTFIPSVDWSEVSELIIDLEYDDSINDYHMQKTHSFQKETAKAERWTFPLRDPEQGAYRFKQTLLFANGSVKEEDWQARASYTQTLVLGNARGGVATIEVDPGDVTGLGDVVRRLVVHLTYTDPPNNLIDTQTLVFRDPKPQTWSIARADVTVNQYTYDVEYFMKDGTRRKLDGQNGTISGLKDFLFIPTTPDN
jgi:hypothetical protein